MKKSIELLGRLTWILAFVFVFASCDTADDVDDVIDDIVDKGEDVDDGIYLMGTSSSTSASADYVLGKGFVGSGEERSGFYSAYVYFTAGSFQYVSFVDGDSTIFGGSVESLPLGGGETSDFSYTRGVLAEDGAAIDVADAGVYHVHLDLTTKLFFVTKVDYLEVIGAATEGGWDSGQELAVKSAAADKIVFEGTDIVMRSGEYKFRYNSNWDTNIEDIEDLNLHSNFGTGGIAGGSNLVFAEADGKYTITVTITTGVDATTTWTFDKTGDVDALPEYPAEMYMIGATIGGWDWAANGIQMIPVHSNPHLFWRIVWMDADAADAGVKFAPVAEWNGDFGVSGEATNGVYAKGSDNVPAPATSGYYTVVVNLEAETIEVNAPLVYGIGDAFGAWDAATEAYKFTVDNDNKVLTSIPFVADASLRIHVAASTLTQAESTNAVDWWQAEFVPIDGVIEYRGVGGDQAQTAVTTGQTVSLDFTTGTASIQ